MGNIYVCYYGVVNSSPSADAGIVYLDSRVMMTNPDGIGFNWVKPQKWEEIYVNTARAMVSQGYDVLIDSSIKVIDYLIEHKIWFTTILPEENIGRDWLKSARKIYSDDSEESQRRLNVISNRFDSDVSAMMELQFPRIVLDSTDYDLIQTIKRYEVEI